jgi:hypothetical protein
MDGAEADVPKNVISNNGISLSKPAVLQVG